MPYGINANGFNPYRVFKFAATEIRIALCSGFSRFQSLSGFQVRCNRFFANREHVTIFRVSIPIGFSSSLQRRGICLRVRIHSRFQSLSGFQVRCNHNRRATACRDQEVSIPIGFSSSLQRYDGRSSATHREGFNPYRVFKFAATVGIANDPVRRHKVSIPIGFSSSLQHTSSPDRKLAIVTFQSLSGFQVRCNIGKTGPRCSWSRFQSLSGFQVRCNLSNEVPNNGDG